MTVLNSEVSVPRKIYKRRKLAGLGHFTIVVLFENDVISIGVAGCGLSAECAF